MLYCENVNLQELADKEGTPLYVYSKHTILSHFHRLRESLEPLNAEVAYAVKACSNIAILNLMARNGAGFDIVSGGELFRVIKAGGDPSKCTYAGVGKTEKEIRYALEQGIYCFNVESEAGNAQRSTIFGRLHEPHGPGSRPRQPQRGGGHAQVYHDRQVGEQIRGGF